MYQCVKINLFSSLKKRTKLQKIAEAFAVKNGQKFMAFVIKENLILFYMIEAGYFRISHEVNLLRSTRFPGKQIKMQYFAIMHKSILNL